MSQPSQRPQSLDLTDLAPDRRAPYLEPFQKDINAKTWHINDANRKFISAPDLKRIIRAHKQTLFAFERWNQGEIENVTKRSYQVLAILAMTGAFSQVKTLRGLFFGNESSSLRLTNRDLWLENGDKIQGLGHLLVEGFLDKQYVIKPYSFDPGNEQPLEIPKLVHLPFKNWEEYGSGSSSLVSKVVIASGHRILSTGKRNLEEEVFALKQITEKERFLEEVKNLKTLRDNVTKNDHILFHYASFLHRDKLNILLPFATFYDLDIFLDEGHKLGEECMYQFVDKFPRFKHGSSDSMLDLITQFYQVANAVFLLHDQIHINDIHHSLIHMDLKPENILITDARTDGSFPVSSVGTWKIADFGFSVLKEGTAGDYYKNKPQSYSSRSGTIPRRPQGTYQAPEVQLDGRMKAGRPSDIWSLACIFSEILAFGLGGRNSLGNFRHQRAEGFTNDYFYYNALGNNTLDAYRVREIVTRWLKKQAAPNTWERGVCIDCCVDVVLNALQIDPKSRPKASEFRDAIHAAKGHQRDYTVGEPCGQKANPSNLTTSPTTADEVQQSSSRLRRSASNVPLCERFETVKLYDLCDLNQSKSLSTPSGIINASICPKGEAVVWLFDNRLSLTSLSELGSPLHSSNNVIFPDELDKGVKWKRVEIAANFIIVLGHQREDRNQKLVYLYDTTRTGYRPNFLPENNSPDMSFVQDIAVLSSGFVVLKGTRRIVLYDIRSLPAVKKVSDDFALPDHSFNEVLSSYGNTFVTWSHHTQEEDALYCWRVSLEPKVILAVYRFDKDSDPSLPNTGGVQSLFLGPSVIGDPSAICVGRDRHKSSSFFTTQVQPHLGSRSTAKKVYTTLDIRDFELGTVLSNTHLLILIKKSKKTTMRAHGLSFGNEGWLSGKGNPLKEFKMAGIPLKMRTITTESDSENIIIILDDAGNIWRANILSS